jgi:hypothetical protein
MNFTSEAIGLRQRGHVDGLLDLYSYSPRGVPRKKERVRLTWGARKTGAMPLNSASITPAGLETTIHGLITQVGKDAGSG